MGRLGKGTVKQNLFELVLNRSLLGLKTILTGCGWSVLDSVDDQALADSTSGLQDVETGGKR